MVAALLGACSSSSNSNYSGSDGYGEPPGGNDSSSSSSSPSNAPTAPSYETADGINGGRLYSKFWAQETGFTLDNSNLSSQAELDNIDEHADFFRCKQCHGWDRLGREGGYSNRAPSATRPNVSPVNLALRSEMLSPELLFDAIKSGSNRRDLSADLSSYDPSDDTVGGDLMPSFGAILTDGQIWDIVKYLKEEAWDTAELYDIDLADGEDYPNRSREFSNIGSAEGNGTRGDIIFADTCAMCHGADGTQTTATANGLVDGGEYTVGRHVRSKPYEDQHKIKFGHLGSTMHAGLITDLQDAKDLFKALTDIAQYPNEQVPALDGQALFNSKCSGCHSKASRAGATASSIRRAINNNAGGQMGGVSATDDELEAIAAYINE